MRRLAPLLLVFLLGCPGALGLTPDPLDPLPGRDGVEGTLMQLADFQQPCLSDDGVIILCRRVRFEGEDAWTDLQANVQGFTPKWGVRSLLDVEITEEAGQTSYLKLHTLDEEDHAPGGVFELTLRPDYLVGGARLVGGRDIDCSTHELCTLLDERLEVGDRFPAWFQHPEDDEEPLVLVSVPEG